MAKNFLKHPNEVDIKQSLAEYYEKTDFAAQEFYDLDQEHLIKTMMQTSLDIHAPFIYENIFRMKINEKVQHEDWVLIRKENPQNNVFALEIKSNNSGDHNFILIEADRKLNIDAVQKELNETVNTENFDPDSPEVSLLYRAMIGHIKNEDEELIAHLYNPSDEMSQPFRIIFYDMTQLSLKEDDDKIETILSKIIKNNKNESSQYKVGEVILNNFDTKTFVNHGKVYSDIYLDKMFHAVKNIISLIPDNEKLQNRIDKIFSVSYLKDTENSSLLLSEIAQKTVYLDTGKIQNNCEPLTHSFLEAVYRRKMVSLLEDLPIFIRMLEEQDYINGNYFVFDNIDYTVKYKQDNEFEAELIINKSDTSYIIEYHLNEDEIITARLCVNEDGLNPSTKSHVADFYFDSESFCYAIKPNTVSEHQEEFLNVAFSINSAKYKMYEESPEEDNKFKM